jgi:hypothetical protein
VESADVAHESLTGWKRRSAELDARIRDLHERNAQLSAGFGAGLEGRTAGSTPAQVAKARTLAGMASTRALEAVERTAMMRLSAASAHDRAARLHDMLADVHEGDVGQHRERAAMHRQQASEDRAAADRIFRSGHVAPPQSGHS